MKVLNAEQMRAADAHAIEDLNIPSLTLMEKAATLVVEVLLRSHTEPVRTVVVCGKGNNGGDGLAVARLLKEREWSPQAVLIARAADLRGDPAVNWKRALDAGVDCAEDPDGANLQDLTASCAVVVDALFGTGLSKPLEGVYSKAVQIINRAGKEVIAVDVPSGLSADSGALSGPAVKATATVALAALKCCHVLSPACRMCGEIFVEDIGIPVESTISVVRSRDIRRILPHRSVDTHKGTFGHAVIVGGSTGKSGAPYLSGKAALRCGAGLVTVVCPSRIQPVIASYGPEIMTHPAGHDSDVFDECDMAGLSAFLKSMSAVAIGPGMGTDSRTAQFFREIVATIDAPLVIDADGLNLLAMDKSVILNRRPGSTILTPHPGEMGRLLNCPASAVQSDRIAAATKLAVETRSVVVLKGFRTIIAHSQADARIVLTGGPALASAGTGDILTGFITGFLAQRLAPVEAAMAGTYLHGLVSNLFEQRYPQQALNALDILQWWHDAVAAVRNEIDIEGDYLKLHFEF